MKGIQFQRYAPNAGLQIGAAAASGLNNAISNYAKMHMQKMQMQSMQSRNAAQAQYMQARAASMNRQNMNADMSRVQFAHDYANYMNQSGNKDAAKAVTKAAQPMVDRLVQNMPPEQANSLRSRIQQEIQGGMPVPELAGETNLNPSEQKMLSGMNANDAKLGAAQIGGQSRLGVAGIAGQSRENVANTQAGARVGVAGIYAGNKNKDEQLKDITSQINTTAKSLSPSNPLAGALDPEAKAGLQAHLNDLQTQYHALSSAQAPQSPQSAPQQAPQPATQSGALPAAKTPKIYNADQWQQAQPGDYVTHSSGQSYQAVGNGGFIPAQAPQTAIPALVAAPGQ